MKPARKPDAVEVPSGPVGIRVVAMFDPVFVRDLGLWLSPGDEMLLPLTDDVQAAILKRTLKHVAAL